MNHPTWADPPYPDIPPTRFARLLIRMTQWLRART